MTTHVLNALKSVGNALMQIPALLASLGKQFLSTTRAQLISLIVWSRALALARAMSRMGNVITVTVHVRRAMAPLVRRVQLISLSTALVNAKAVIRNAMAAVVRLTTARNVQKVKRLCIMTRKGL